VEIGQKNEGEEQDRESREFEAHDAGLQTE
jgi:hypothetical protein